jgi:hypothetical protein
VGEESGNRAARRQSGISERVNSNAGYFGEALRLGQVARPFFSYAATAESAYQFANFGYNVRMPDQNLSIEATELYAEAIRLRKIADLLVEKSELISQRAFSPTDSAIPRILEIHDELASLGWPLRELSTQAKSCSQPSSRDA